VSRLAITDIAVSALKTPGIFMDKRLPAFGIRVGKKRKTWFIVPDQRRVTKVIGHYPDMSVAAARDTARKLLATRSPFREIKLDEAAAQFLALHKEKVRPATHYSVQRHLNSYIVPTLGNRPLADIRAHELMKIVEAIKFPAEAAKTFHIAKQFWRWASARGHCPHILMQLGPPSHSPQRDRVLSDQELKAIWNAAAEIGGHYATIVKLLVLTGQRRGEIATLQTSWIQTDRINLPKEIVKNGRPHTFPIGVLSVTFLTQPMNTHQPASGYIFLQKAKLFSDWSKSKILLDQISGITNYCLHDLRRSFATNMAKLGVRIEVIERLLNHQSGTFRGVVGTYQRYDFWPEMRDAVDRYEAWLTDLIGQNKNVVHHGAS
jgi:integrase